MLALAVTSCADGARKADPWCMTNTPNRPNAQEIAAMSDKRVSEQLAHNRYGAKRCGWKV